MNGQKMLTLITDIFRRRGADSYLGEHVTMAQHMLQAAQLAEEDGDDNLIVAALLHDIGHYTNEFPENALEVGINNRHDEAGAAVLTGHFPEIVIDCIRYHVEAKRYLCAVEDDYYEKLSPASIHTLNLQGGVMSKNEVDEFSTQPHLQAIVKVRRWDELAKKPDQETQPFEYYLPFLKRVIN